MEITSTATGRSSMRWIRPEWSRLVNCHVALQTDIHYASSMTRDPSLRRRQDDIRESCLSLLKKDYRPSSFALHQNFCRIHLTSLLVAKDHCSMSLGNFEQGLRCRRTFDHSDSWTTTTCLRHTLCYALMPGACCSFRCNDVQCLWAEGKANRCMVNPGALFAAYMQLCRSRLERRHPRSVDSKTHTLPDQRIESSTLSRCPITRPKALINSTKLSS
ncbi:hypothetical protein GGR57DRAFT_334012 [Xylariaceae sp. FL1272]|nr:hypothetical protein GGR57DRAFT_334012 [Xylariaceae sp. FL1272]